MECPGLGTLAIWKESSQNLPEVLRVESTYTCWNHDTVENHHLFGRLFGLGKIVA